MREKHHYVAQYLESKMVFAVSGIPSGNNGNGGDGGGGVGGGGGGTPESVASVDSARASSYEEDEDDYEDEDEEEAVYCGLRSKDLQEAKEQESTVASSKANISQWVLFTLVCFHVCVSGNSDTPSSVSAVP